jgi:hypothetical protein
LGQLTPPSQVEKWLVCGVRIVLAAVRVDAPSGYFAAANVKAPSFLAEELVSTQRRKAETRFPSVTAERVITKEISFPDPLGHPFDGPETLVKGH